MIWGNMLRTGHILADVTTRTYCRTVPDSIGMTCRLKFWGSENLERNLPVLIFCLHGLIIYSEEERYSAFENWTDINGLPSMQYRWNVYKGVRAAIDANEGGLDKFSQGESAPQAVCIWVP